MLKNLKSLCNRRIKNISNYSIAFLRLLFMRHIYISDKNLKYLCILISTSFFVTMLIGCSSGAINDIASPPSVDQELNGNEDLLWGSIHVPDDYASIQAAIDAAKLGEIILVRPGIYRENINFKGKRITLSSIDPENPDIVAQTIIDGGNNGSTIIFNKGENPDSVISGFTITGGSGNQKEYRIKSYDGTELFFTRNYGGGILITNGSSPTIKNNVITKNVVNNISEDILGIGGGIAILANSSPQIIDNMISDNHAEGYGGGIAVWNLSNPVIRNNAIRNNSAGEIGGGIMIAMMCSPEVKENIIENNYAIWGGGIYVAHMSEAEIISNRVKSNEAESGAGIFARKTERVLLADNILSDNTASRYGGAIYLDNQATVTVHYNFIENNLAALAGGGIWVDSDSRAYLIWLDKDSFPHYTWPDDYNNQGNSPDNFNLRKADFSDADLFKIPLKYRHIEEYLMQVFPESHRRTWIPEFNSIEELSNQDKLYIVFFSRLISYSADDTISAENAEKAAISIFGYNAIEHENVSPYYTWNDEERTYRWGWPAGTAGSSKIKIISINETADLYIVDAVPYIFEYYLHGYEGDYIYDDNGNLVTHIFGVNEANELAYLPFMPVRRFILTKKSDGSCYLSQSYKIP